MAGRLTRIAPTPDAPISEPGKALPAGHNNPPETLPIVDRLQEKHRALFGSLGEFELVDLPAPDAIKSDDDAAKVTAFATQVRAKAREAEKTREEEKADILKAGRAIDDLFKRGLHEPLIALAKSAEDRLKPYLTAKAAAEEARIRAEQARIAAAAEEARVREAAARAAAEAAEAEAKRAAEAVRAAETDEAREAAAEQLQAAETTRQTEQEAATQAGKDIARADRVVGQQEKVLSGGASRLAKTRVGDAPGAGSATVQETWIHSIDDPAALTASLGPLGPYFPAHVLTDALKRVAAEHKGDLAIPGVRFSKDLTVRTR